jgi:hypothetical protein
MMVRSRARRDNCSCRHHIPTARHLEKSMVRRPPSSPHPSLHPSHRRARATPRRIPVLLLLLLLLLLILAALQRIQCRQRTG